MTGVYVGFVDYPNREIAEVSVNNLKIIIRRKMMSGLIRIKVSRN